MESVRELIDGQNWFDDITKRVTPRDCDTVSVTGFRWMLIGDDRPLMYGEGLVKIGFSRIGLVGVDPSKYELLVGEKVGLSSERKFAVKTVDGVCVGYVIGLVEGCESDGEVAVDEVREQRFREIREIIDA